MRTSITFPAIIKRRALAPFMGIIILFATVLYIYYSGIFADLPDRWTVLGFSLAAFFLLLASFFIAYVRSYRLSVTAQELQHEIERRRSLVEQAVNGIFLTDADTRILEVNTSGAAMLGYTSDELTGTLMYELFRHEAPKEILSRLIAAYHGKPINLEAEMICKTGAVLPVELSWKMMDDGTMQTIVRDITTRKRAEKEILESRALLANTEHLGKIGGFTIDARTLEQAWTDETFNILEIDREKGELNFSESITMVVPSSRKAAEDAFERALEKGESSEEELQFITAKGHLRWIHMVASAQTENGRTTHISGFIQDITERKQIEEKLRRKEEEYRTLVEKIDEGFCIVELLYDADGKAVDYRFIEINHTFEDQTGLRDAVGKTARELVPDIEENWFEIYGRVAETGEPVRFEAPVAAMGRLYNVFAYRIGGEGSNKIGVLFSDIKERRDMEKLLRDVQRREAIGALSAGIAHDFNNLLAVMMGNISLAQMKLPGDHPASKHIEQSLTAIESAAELTSQILAYAGKGQFQIRIIDLAEEIRTHVALFHVSIPKNVRLSTALPKDPVYVKGDPGQIKQIVMNLVLNAADSVEDALSTVTVALSSVEWGEAELRPYGMITNTVLKEGRYALLEVRDRGKGMDAETMEKIFDPFFTTKFIGRGLGLSAVLGIIRMHEGGIRVESEVGKGTTFAVLLPTVPPPAPGEAPTASEPAQSDVVPANKRVLVIEDEEDVASMVRDILEQEHLAVLAETNPLQGIEVYREHRSEIGVVLLDLTMPEMSGEKVAERLKEIDPNVRIIVSSGYSQSEAAKRMGPQHAAGFIQKPYTIQSLVTLVKSML